MKFFFLILSALFFFSCQSKKESVSNKAWLLQRIEYPDENASTDYRAEAINPMVVSQESFISIREDGKYSSYFGKYEQGEWEIKNNQLILKPLGDYKRIPFEIRSFKEGK